MDHKHTRKCDYTIYPLEFLKQLNLLYINYVKAQLQLSTESKPSKKPLLSMLNLIRGGQLQKKWFDSFQLLLIATYPAIIRLCSLSDSC